MPRRLHPSDLLRDRPTVIDIREPEERELMGWIPGSLHRPGAPPEVLSEAGGVVLACATGRRTQEVLAVLEQQGIDGSDLEGGLLAWSAVFPVSTVPEVGDGEPVPLADFVRQLRSCFVVESVESGAIEATDPMDVISQVLEGIEEDRSVAALRDRVDELAHRAWCSGHRLDFIEEHVRDFYGLSQRVVFP